MTVTVGSTLAFGRRVEAGVTARSAASRVALSAGLLAVACVLGLVESSLPPIAVAPWLRVGFANIAVVVALLALGPRTAGLVSGGKVLIVALLTGTLATPAFLMAAAGATASVIVMAVLVRSVRTLSAVGLSAAGSAAHVAAQFGAAAAVLGTPSLLVLAPPSVLVALALGAVTGVLAGVTVSRLNVR